jgi:UDP-N-acetylmuramate--alanine ligase
VAADQDRTLHFVGIGGAGMSGLALVMHRLGARVSGSDRERSSYSERLEQAGVAVSIGHSADNLPAGAEVVVSTAIAGDNPELERARELGLTVLHRSDLLAELAARKRCIAVAGAHGKTTTTAMIAHVLTACDRDPAYFVGGEVAVGGVTANAAWGDGEWVVVEADESDRSFLKLSPEVAVVTNVELDHHTTYGGKAELFDAFRDFCDAARSLVLWRGQPELAQLASPDRRVVSYGVQGDGDAQGGNADLVAHALDEPAGAGGGIGFSVTVDGREHACRLQVRGRHNAQNALAAVAAAGLAGVEASAALAALESFSGVGRRFERLGTEPHGAHVYDDYAHHPTEVAAALRTARAVAGDGRVVAVFQPHLYSRTQSLARSFGRALAQADAVCVLEVYPARELASDFPGVSGYQVATATADARRGIPVYWTPSRELAKRALGGLLCDGDLCVTIGAGDITELGHDLVAQAGAAR